MKHKRIRLLMVCAGKILKKALLLVLLLALIVGGENWTKTRSSQIDNPYQISSEVVIERLYSEGNLSVLEAVGRASYQVEDPGTVRILSHKISIPGLQKKVCVDYEYKIHLGVDLTQLTAGDITINESIIDIMLPRPEIVSLEIYNDKAQTTGGFLIFKANPRDDLVEMCSDRDEYIDILRASAWRELQESGRYQKLQQAAMNNTVDLLAQLLRDLSSNNELEVSIQFFE